MIITIDPTSGYDNSYYDIKFNVISDSLKNSTLQIFNKTTNEQLKILAISSGFIDETGSVHNCSNSEVYGYMNLFNDDKMNEALEKYKKIDLEIVITNETLTEKEIVSFYNESFSSDSEIVPIDFSIINTEPDLSIDEYLEIEIKADFERNFHFLIESIGSKVSYDFYVYTKNGNLSVKIPLEILNYELNLYKTSHLSFRCYYMKQHGVNYANVISEKKVLIHSEDINFSGKLRLKPQTRKDPLGNEMSYEEFVTSDRYFIPTWKDYSFLTRLQSSSQKMSLMIDFKDEILFSRKENMANVLQANQWISEEKRPIKQSNGQTNLFYQTMMNVYDQKTLKTSSKTDQMISSMSFQPIGGSDCAECARKKRNRNITS